ncbi:MAG TPA: acylphosphatase [Alphaproteobacteria bacterium]
MEAVRIVVHGRVQGVWFRAWTREQAVQCGLAGWVRNRRDGTVETLLSGPDAAVEDMIARCRVGPPAARVDHVERFAADAPDHADFRQLPTA